jgi:diguanylate cyclase
MHPVLHRIHASCRRWLVVAPAMAERALQDNLGRLRWLAIVVIALNLVHVLVFQVSGASPDPVVQGWKSSIVLAHLGMAGVMGALLLALRSAARARPDIRRQLHRAVEVAGCLGGMGFAILLVAIDQAITPSITPYLVASMLAGSLLLLRPWFALLLSVASGGAFWWAMGVAQVDPVLCLTNRVNGVTTASIGLLLAVIFWRKFVSHETLVTELEASRAELLRHQVELEHQARHDGLTGLQTRLEFRRSTEHELALAQYHGQETSLILVDLDLFKRINDTCGHPVGDAVLVAVARALCEGGAARISWGASAARNSSSCCRARWWTRPSCWPNACANRCSRWTAHPWTGRSAPASASPACRAD